jgi:hypothetical protein
MIDLSLLLLSQPAPEAAPSIVSMLSEYGGWGVSVVLGGTVIALAKAYKSARDGEIGMLKENNKELIGLTVETNKANQELKTALVGVASAMESMDRRLENVERKLSDR